MFPNKIVKIVQIFMYPLVYIPFRLLYKKELIIDYNFKKEERYIFVANHPSRIDPFLMFYLLPFKTLIKILPLRFMTAKKYINNPFSFFFSSLIGCYPVEKNTIKDSIKYLENKNNLCIFIQGRVEKECTSNPKVGAIYVERESKNSYLLPVKIEYSKTTSLRKKILIHFKNKVKHKKFSKDLQRMSNNLLKKIME